MSEPRAQLSLFGDEEPAPAAPPPLAVPVERSEIASPDAEARRFAVDPRNHARSVITRVDSGYAKCSTCPVPAQRVRNVI